MLVSEQAAQVVETTSDAGPVQGDQAELYVPPTGVHPTQVGLPYDPTQPGLPYVPSVDEQIARALGQQGREHGPIPPDVEDNLLLTLAHKRIETLTKQRNALAHSADTLVVYLQRAMRNLPRSDRELIEADIRREPTLIEPGLVDIIFPPTKRRESR